jgi:hypothetical protein
MNVSDLLPFAIGESRVVAFRAVRDEGEPVTHPRARVTRTSETTFDVVPVDEDGLTWAERMATLSA